MRFNKKLYKYTSIISISIVIMLLANIFVPTLTIAGSTNSDDVEAPTVSDIQLNGNTLSVSGSMDATSYTQYSIYWSKGTVNAEAGTSVVDTMDKLAQWFMDDANKITYTTGINVVPDESDATKCSFNSSITIDDVTEKNATYNVLCIATDETVYAYSMKTITLNVENPTDPVPGQPGDGDDGEADPPADPTDPTDPIPGQPGDDDDGEADPPTDPTDPTPSQPGDDGDEGADPPAEPTKPTDQTPEKTEDDEPIVVNVGDKNKTNEYVEADVTGGDQKQSGNKNVDDKKQEQYVEDKNVQEPQKDDNTNKEEQQQEIKTQDVTNKTEEDIPQTGSNDSVMIAAIIIFSLISLGSFIKYKKA